MRFYLILKVLLVCSFYIVLLKIGTAIAGAPKNLVTWVNSNTETGENVLCQKNIENDYFFVTTKDRKLKTGYFLDVTGKSSRPKSYVISWAFKNNDGEYLEIKKLPMEIKRSYVNLGNKIYSENIAYQYVDISKSEKIWITVDLKKYEMGDENGSSMKTLNLCEVLFH